MALDRPLKALALSPPGHLHPIADREGIDRYRLPDAELAGLVAELRQHAVGRGVGLAQVPQLGARQRLLLAAVKGELDRLVPVAVRGPDRGHRTRPGFQDGHPLDAAVVGEPLSHTELASQDRSHVTIPTGGRS